MAARPGSRTRDQLFCAASASTSDPGPALAGSVCGRRVNEVHKQPKHKVQNSGVTSETVRHRYPTRTMARTTADRSSNPTWLKGGRPGDTNQLMTRSSVSKTAT